jgi:YD repeat-containing protein
LTGTKVTNALGQSVTTTIEPTRGVPTHQVDIAGHITDAAYDALGRLIAVWKPGQTKPASGTTGATATYAYQVDPTKPLAVTTKTLVDHGDGTALVYTTSVALDDSLGRTLQTQADAEGGGRVVTDTMYDSHGWVAATNNRWVTSGAPAATLIGSGTGADPSNVNDRTVNSYDGSGRITQATEYTFGAPTWSTKTVYGGDRTTVVSPTGGIESTTITDARGHTTELDQYTSPPSIDGSVVSGGHFQATKYGYTPTGQQNRMTDPAGNAWTTTYDLAGRAVAKTDPDSGASSSTYDWLGEVTSETDADSTLAYTYDKLGRVPRIHVGHAGRRLDLRHPAGRAAHVVDPLRRRQRLHRDRRRLRRSRPPARLDGQYPRLGAGVRWPVLHDEDRVHGGRSATDYRPVLARRQRLVVGSLEHLLYRPREPGQPRRPQCLRGQGYV